MHAATHTMPFSLAPHVRARGCEGQVILLDMRSSRYIGVGPGASAALSRCVQGWPSTLEDSSAAPAPQATIDTDALIQQFTSQGLLSGDRVQSPLATPLSTPLATQLATADASLDFEDLSMPVQIGAARVTRLLKGAALSALRLRFQSFEFIARAVAARRHRHQSDQATSPDILLASMRDSAVAYERMRPFLFTSHRKCLFDSLACLEFLAGEGLFPHWVIGVKTKPFGAHSWVQQGCMVLNDQHARVRQFHPILVA
ncbi:lasso peptide biosynthesis B2 protein [Burkholderiaceae bacterium UC74_6]